MRSSICAGVAILLTGALATPTLAVYEIGDVVDNFTVVDTDGIPRNLYDYKGKVIVLNFGEYWCGPCISEWTVMPEQFWDPNKNSGVMVFTIGSDSEPAFKAKADQYSGGWPWLFDTTGNLYWDYGNGYIPYNAVLDQDFRLVWGESGWYGNFDHMQAAIDPLLKNVVVHRMEPNSVTASAGDMVTVDITLENREKVAATATAEIDAIVPGHTEYHGNPMKTQNVRLDGGDSRTQSVRMRVPRTARNGDYFIRVGIGGNEDSPAASDVLHLRVE